LKAPARKASGRDATNQTAHPCHWLLQGTKLA
jgi:hypothetical protein